MAITPEIWTLIVTVVGVTVGAFIGYLLESFREKRRARERKEKWLKDLLANLEYNKMLLVDGINYQDLRTLVLNNYLLDLPDHLRTKIYEVQRIISRILLPWSGDAQSFARLISPKIEKLIGLLESIIPELKEYLKNKKYQRAFDQDLLLSKKNTGNSNQDTPSKPGIAGSNPAGSVLQQWTKYL